MAKEIRWSVRADKERLAIIAYWANRNKSIDYSIKLNKLFIEKIQLLADNNDLGKKTDHHNIRIKIIRDYFIYYKIFSDHIKILSIWDCRRNPQKFKL